MEPVADVDRAVACRQVQGSPPAGTRMDPSPAELSTASNRRRRVGRSLLWVTSEKGGVTLISLVSVFFLPETHRRDLRDATAYDGERTLAETGTGPAR